MDTTVFIKQNENWNADPNAPIPIINVSGSSLQLEFYANHFQFHDFSAKDRIVLAFENCVRYRLGDINDEGWYGGQCRFSKMAPKWGEFYEIQGETFDAQVNEWVDIANLQTKPARHFLFYFRDETFECKASAWSMQIRKAGSAD